RNDKIAVLCIPRRTRRITARRPNFHPLLVPVSLIRYPQTGPGQSVLNRISSMPAILLDGKKLSQTMQAETTAAATVFTQKVGLRTGLAAVWVGDNPASRVYVRNKRKACQQAGFESWLHELPHQTTQAELLELVSRLNRAPEVHGILVQLPLPPQI